ncbi:MAG: ribonuclease H family protein [Bacillus sp. (in: Bacteria)]|nr:ribonuclease H family protein [Bacillus sp. (in: firmicutes)]
MDVSIELTYKTPKGTETIFTSDAMNSEKALLIAEDLLKTGRLKNIKFIDSRDNSWTLKELKKFMDGIQTEAHNITVYFDGGFDLQTKSSGLGVAIYYDKNGKSYRLRKNAMNDLLDSNNEAEYAAMYLSIQELELLDVHHLPVKFIGDSQVVINQLSGEWPCMEETLNEWADKIEGKLEALGIHPDYQLVSRKHNQEADQLATQALKEIEISSTTEMEN